MIIKRIDYKDTLNIRHEVLWPNKPIEFCLLDDDPEGIHYGGFIDSKLISVASIFLDNGKARLRKFATLKEYQGKGYGTLIINKILSDLEGLDVNIFWCDARKTAEGFYNHFLMEKQGDIFLKSDVEYIVMQRKIKSSL
ncbi:MAG: GNAT family N-acetyltransferase [Spirochaetaceae bacterium]